MDKWDAEKRDQQFGNKPQRREVDWVQKAKESRERAEAEKVKEQEEKNKLISDTKAAMEAVKRD